MSITTTRKLFCYSYLPNIAFQADHDPRGRGSRPLNSNR